MHNTIFRKTIFAYIIFALLSFLGIATLAYRIDYNRMTEQITTDMYQQAIAIAQTYGSHYYSSSQTLDEINDQLTSVAVLSENRIMFISRQNSIILDTGITGINNVTSVANITNTDTVSDFGSTFNNNIATDSNSRNSSFTMIPDFDPAASGNKIYTSGDFYGLFTEEHLTVTVPITYNLMVRGYVAIHKPVSTVNQNVNMVFNTNYFTMLICFICAFVFLYTTYHNVHKPLEAVSKAVTEYGSGNLNYRIEKYKNDEIGRLAVSLNYMAGQLDELEQSERAFVANVSHDFRSPLTSIKGYLEAIMDGTIPYEMQNKYLNIVIAETDRLTKLTNNLLSLNNMETRRNHLNYEVADINMIIKKTLETFEGTCKAKGIKFELEFVEQNIPVKIDVDKITQVIYNLVDNAIKFSHNNSTIIIKVSERGEKAFVSIKDTGIGIPKESITKIWDRFYKTDLSRGKDKKGTGLGLAIVKEIIKTHNENIDVISTEGVGTEFIFSLTRDVSDTL